MLTAEQIVRILGPADADLVAPYDDAVSVERRKISARYAELKRGMPFLESALQARTEWLEAQMKDWGKE